MTATNQFFVWYYFGLDGIGGWVLFFLLALAAVIYLLYDSQKRHLPAVGWRMGVVLVACLMLLTVIYRFTVTDPSNPSDSPLSPYTELIFYVGMLGGVLPPLIAVGYYVTFQGMAVCKDGHLYEIALGQCPDPSHRPILTPPMPYPPQSRRDREPIIPPSPSKQKAQAWLVAQDGHSYQLNRGETTLGRSARNDLKFDDSTISREHAKIIEENGHFRLIDLGSANGTRVNNRIIRQAVLLEQDDIIQLGDNTVLRFLTAH